MRAICRDYGVVCIRREGHDVEKVISENSILNENKVTKMCWFALNIFLKIIRAFEYGWGRCVFILIGDQYIFQRGGKIMMSTLFATYILAEKHHSCGWSYTEPDQLDKSEVNNSCLFTNAETLFYLKSQQFESIIRCASGNAFQDSCQWNIWWKIQWLIISKNTIYTSIHLKNNNLLQLQFGNYKLVPHFIPKTKQ